MTKETPGPETEGREVQDNTQDDLPSSDELRQAEIQTPEEIAEDYAERIYTAWQKSAESILELGRLLNEAKRALAKHGQWLPFLTSRLPFSHDVAQRLMAIAENPVLSNTGHARFLPGSYETLYALSRVDKKLGDGTLEDMIKTGEISPETTRKEVGHRLEFVIQPPIRSPGSRCGS